MLKTSETESPAVVAVVSGSCLELALLRKRGNMCVVGVEI